MKIVINGTDWTSKFNPYSAKFWYEKVQGQNGGTSMAGSTILDVIAVKENFELTAPLLTQSDYTALMDLAKQDLVTATYDGPDTNASKTKSMILTVGEGKQIPLRSKGYVYKNIACKFRER